MVDEFSSLKDFEKQMKKSRKKKTIQWFGGKKKKLIQKGAAAKRKSKSIWRHKGAAVHGTIRSGEAAAKSLSEAGERWGYALPAPFKVFTLAWQKTSKALKTLTIIAFALALLFVPWGVFYYVGWSVGAAFMFLISLIYWAVISLFNAIAFVIVSFINGIATILMGSIVAMVDAVLGALGLGIWENGRYFLDNALIKYSQIANVPSLYHIVEPTWQSFMNDTIIGHILGWFKIEMNLSWMVAPFREFYAGVLPEQAVILGLVIISVPLVFLGYVYYKNRHHLSG